MAAKPTAKAGGYDYDLFVIGAGSGGVRAARVAARHGAKVAIAEESRVGGTCVIRGCIPKKILVYAAHVREEIEDAKGYGWNIPKPSFDWGTLIDGKNREIDRLNLIYKDLLAQSGVTLFEARAHFADAHTIEVGGKRVTADTILLAVGAWPVKPTASGAEHMVTSNEALELAKLPKRILIVGGGYIAVEFAGIFHGVGAEVVQIHRGDKILRGFDEDIRSTLASHMRARGIDLRCGKTIEKLEKIGDCYRTTLSDEAALDTDLVMVATGRKPLTANLGLDVVGVELDQHGAVKVDEYSQTTVENIYAIGDCTNRLNLTPVAIREGMAFADTVFGGTPTAMEHENVPSAVFSQPPIAVVGLTEEKARRRYGAVDVYKTMFRPLQQILPRRDERTLMKLIVERASRRVVGAHMIGQDAPEIVQGVAIAVRMGATKADFDATVPIHPTAAEEWLTLRVKEADPIAEAAE